MLWRFERASASVPWPDDLPPPPKDVLPPKEGGVYKHVLPVRHEAAVKKLLAAMGGHSAVEHNGHKWFASMRRRVPEEQFIQDVILAIWKQQMRK
jgi:hypothetical protein